jgi:hypothetical protein
MVLRKKLSPRTRRGSYINVHAYLLSNEDEDGERGEGEGRGEGEEEEMRIRRGGEWYEATHPNIVAYEHGAFGLRSLFCCFTGGFAITRNGGPNQGIVSYEYFLKTAKTGDILLFEGIGVFSWAIQCFTQVRYSHVGMVVRIRDEDTGEDHLFIWESTTQDQTYDFLTRRDKNGPRLVSAHEKLYQYAKNNYTISYRPMRIDDPRVIADMEDGLTDLYLWAVLFSMSKVPYETDVFELTNAHLRLITGITEQREKGNRFAMFCSELVSYTYRNGMGFSFVDHRISRAMAPEDFTPEDFAEETQGIPFAMDFYRGEHQGVLVRPAQAIFGGQYIIATASRMDKLLDFMYKKFLRSLRSQMDRMIQESIPEIVNTLKNYQKELSNRRRDGEGGLQDVPLTRLRFVYRLNPRS